MSDSPDDKISPADQLAQAMSERDELRRQLEAMRATLGERVREIEGLRRGAAMLTENSKRMSDGLLAKQRDLRTLQMESQQVKSERDALLRRVAELERPVDPDGKGSSRPAAAAPTAAGTPQVESGNAGKPPAPATHPVVVVDASEFGSNLARRLSERGTPAITMASDPLLGFEMTEQAPALSINLALLGAWGNVRRSCGLEGYTTQPIVAYALPPAATRGAWLGPVDFAILPLEDPQLGQLLRRRFPNLKRALLVSPRTELISQIRTILEGSQVFVSVVLDSHETPEMMRTVRPEVAIIHLSPACPDAFRVINELRKTTATIVPFVFILDAAAQPADLRFLVDGMQALANPGRFSEEQLADACMRSVASLLERR